MTEEKRSSFPVQLIAIPALFITILFLGIYLITESDRLRIYPLTDYDLVIPTDSVSIQHGERVYTLRGCVDCHGEQLSGRVIESGILTGVITAPNITRGRGSAIRDYSTEDLVRVIREGVKPNRRSVIMMPSHKFQVIHKRDIEALIAYLRSVEPVDRSLPATKLNYPVRLYYFVNRNLGLFPANMIRRPLEFADETPQSRYEMGQYIATSCVGCHGYKLEGGRVPGAPPNWPEAGDLTSSGVAGSWQKEEFIRSMRQGLTPDGRHLDSRYMPWQAFGMLSDEEFDLLWDYMQSL